MDGIRFLTMSVAMLKYILAKSKNPDFRPIFNQALDNSTQRVNTMESIFGSFYHPIPQAFGEKDVDINAPELFSETFMLSYTKTMNKFILENHANAYDNTQRADIFDFFYKCMDTTRDNYKEMYRSLIS